MDKLAGWILERMAAYKGGGVPYSEAAQFVTGEMAAMYHGNHWKNGKRSPRPRLPYDDAISLSCKYLEEIKGCY